MTTKGVDACVVCGKPLPASGAIHLRYEQRTYAFDATRCKLVFQENPDRYLDASGEVLPEPR